MLSLTMDLTADERAALERLTRTRRGRADLAKRARVILLLAEGRSYADIRAAVGCGPTFIAQWKQRFAEGRVAGLAGRHRGRKAWVLTPRLRARILAWTRKSPPDGSTHWSTRKLATALGIDHLSVLRTWREAGLQPHRLERYLRSTDPAFEAKAAEIIGLYLDPPQHAAVFCVDEKSAIQALDRLDPVLPLSPGRAERHGFEYRRHGTLSLFAAFNTQTGEVFGQTATRHTSADFVVFLDGLVATQPPGRAIHVILDNLAIHKTEQVRAFLAAHPHVALHFTPTYSSWLNQVELWFAKVERDVTARGIFTSVPDLARKLRRYIRHYNRTAKPFHWTYADPSRRIA
jgi:transposase